MNQRTYPLLTALAGRGPAPYTGPDLSRLPIEVCGDLLEVSGVTPLRYDGGGDTAPGKEYRYLLKAPDAENLRNR